MIGRVVTDIGNPGLAPADYPPLAAVMDPWRLDRVFTVVAAVADRKQPLAIAKDHPILFVRKGAALSNQRISLSTLDRQFSNRNGRQTVYSGGSFGLNPAG